MVFSMRYQEFQTANAPAGNKHVWARTDVELVSSNRSSFPSTWEGGPRRVEERERSVANFRQNMMEYHHLEALEVRLLLEPAPITFCKIRGWIWAKWPLKVVLMETHFSPPLQSLWAYPSLIPEKPRQWAVGRWPMPKRKSSHHRFSFSDNG